MEREYSSENRALRSRSLFGKRGTMGSLSIGWWRGALYSSITTAVGTADKGTSSSISYAGDAEKVRKERAVLFDFAQNVDGTLEFLSVRNAFSIILVMMIFDCGDGSASRRTLLTIYCAAVRLRLRLRLRCSCRGGGVSKQLRLFFTCIL